MISALPAASMRSTELRISARDCELVGERGQEFVFAAIAGSQCLLGLLERSHIGKGGDSAAHACVRIAQWDDIAIYVAHSSVVEDELHFSTRDDFPLCGPLERQFLHGNRLIILILTEAASLGSCAAKWRRRSLLRATRAT